MIYYGYGFASFLERHLGIDYMLVTGPLLFIFCALIYHMLHQSPWIYVKIQLALLFFSLECTTNYQLICEIFCWFTYVPNSWYSCNSENSFYDYCFLHFQFWPLGPLIHQGFMAWLCFIYLRYMRIYQIILLPCALILIHHRNWHGFQSILPGLAALDLVPIPLSIVWMLLLIHFWPSNLWHVLSVIPYLWKTCGL